MLQIAGTGVRRATEPQPQPHPRPEDTAFELETSAYEVFERGGDQSGVETRDLGQ